MDFFKICQYLNTIRLEYAKKTIDSLNKVLTGDRLEHEWASIVAYVTSYKSHSDIEIFSDNYLNMDTQKLFEWLICRRDFLIYLQEKKTIIELLRKAFEAIVANPQDFPISGIYGHSTIEGRHSYIHGDIHITIQFLVERNEYELTFDEFLAQIPKLVADGNPNWEYS